jgi:hypothetical protein
MSEDRDEPEFSRDFELRRERMLTRPPTCLASFTATLAPRGEPVGVRFDGHGSPDESVFRIACGCGSRLFRVKGRFYERNALGDRVNLFSDPLELTCAACARSGVIFDDRRHGYNVMIGVIELGTAESGRPREPDGGVPAEHACPGCGARVAEVWARFEHCNESCDDSFAAELQTDGREQDYFSWFTLVGRCESCGQVTTVSEAECA